MSFPKTLSFEGGTLFSPVTQIFEFELSGEHRISVLPDLMRLQTPGSEILMTFAEVDIVPRLEVLTSSIFASGAQSTPVWWGLEAADAYKIDELALRGQDGTAYYYDFGPINFFYGEIFDDGFIRNPELYLPPETVGRAYLGYRLVVEGNVNPILELILRDAVGEVSLTPRALVTIGNPTGQRSAAWGGWIETVVLGEPSETELDLPEIEIPELPDLIEEFLGDERLLLDGADILSDRDIIEWLSDESPDLPLIFDLDEPSYPVDMADIILSINHQQNLRDSGRQVEIDLAPLDNLPTDLGSDLGDLSRITRKLAETIGQERSAIGGVVEGFARYDIQTRAITYTKEIAEEIVGGAPRLLKRLPKSTFGKATYALSAIDAAIEGYDVYKRTGDADLAWAAGGRELAINLTTGLGGVLVSRGVGLLAGAAVAATGVAAAPVLITGIGVGIAASFLIESRTSKDFVGSALDGVSEWAPRFLRSLKNDDVTQPENQQDRSGTSFEPAAAVGEEAAPQIGEAEQLRALVEEAQKRVGDIAWIYDADRGVMIKSLRETEPALWSAFEDALGLPTSTPSGREHYVILGDGNETYIYTGRENLYVDAFAGANTIQTGSGDDFIITGTGYDIIDAGPGDDVFIVALGGSNIITGGDGADTFIFQYWDTLDRSFRGMTTADVKLTDWPEASHRWSEIRGDSTTFITDFELGVDRIVIAGLPTMLPRSLGDNIYRSAEGTVIELPWNARIILENFNGIFPESAITYLDDYVYRGSLPQLPIPLFDQSRYATDNEDYVSVRVVPRIVPFAAPVSISVDAPNAEVLEVSGQSLPELLVGLRGDESSGTFRAFESGYWEFQYWEGYGERPSGEMTIEVHAELFESRILETGSRFLASARPQSFDVGGIEFIGNHEDNVIEMGGGGNIVDFRAGGANSVALGGTNDLILGGPGLDTVDYAASPAGVLVNLASGMGRRGHAAGDRYVSIERVVGSDHADVLWGNDEDNVLEGGAGNDFLRAGGGDNFLFGGPGDDRLVAGPGSNVLDGGPGVDTVRYHRSTAGVTVDLGAGTGSGGWA